MESIIYNCKLKKKEGHYGFLPRKFKFVGAGILVLVLLFMMAKVLFSVPLAAVYATEIKSIVFSLLILGLLLIALAKDRVEDERTKQLKIQALAASFIFGGIYMVAVPVVNLFFTEPVLDITGQGLMFYLLAMHVGMFYGQKIDDWYKERKSL